MALAEKANYFLHLNGFESVIKTYWKDLQIENNFCDVTLACDEKQIQTHKLILMSFSPVLKNILRQNLSQHPVIYLRGVKYEDLQNLVNFLYQGDVNVADGELHGFLELAEDLKITGLSVETKGNKENLSPFNSSPKRIRKRRKNVQNDNRENVYDPNSIIKSHKMNDKEDPATLALDNIQKQYICIRCGEQFSVVSDLIDHVESVHVGEHYSCNQCDYKTKREDYLKAHIDAVHDEIYYPCDQCDHKAKKEDDLKAHIEAVHDETVHDEIYYPCDQCDYIATKTNLIKHNELAHNNSQYPCEHCNYTATTIDTLKVHIESLHNVIYAITIPQQKRISRLKQVRLELPL